MAGPSKKCSQCGKPKPLADFPVDRRRRDGRRAACNECEGVRRSAGARVEREAADAPLLEAGEKAHRAAGKANKRDPDLAALRAVCTPREWSAACLAQLRSAQKGSARAFAQLKAMLAEERAERGGQQSAAERRAELELLAGRIAEKLMGDPRGLELGLAELDRLAEEARSA